MSLGWREDEEEWGGFEDVFVAAVGVEVDLGLEEVVERCPERDLCSSSSSVEGFIGLWGPMVKSRSYQSPFVSQGSISFMRDVEPSSKTGETK